MPGGPEPDDLAKLRAAIDGVDDQILALLDRRAEVVQEVGRRKRERREALGVPVGASEVLCLKRSCLEHEVLLPSDRVRKRGAFSLQSADEYNLKLGTLCLGRVSLRRYQVTD